MARIDQARNPSRDGMKKKQKIPSIEQELYQTLFKEAADGVFVSDRRGNYLDANPLGCKMLGYTRRELLKKNLRDMIPAEELKNNPIHGDDLLAGKTVVSQRHLRCKNGKLLPVEITAHMLSNGNLVGIVRDISGRKAADDALRSSEERFSKAFRVSPNGMIISRLSDGLILEVNESFLRMFGYTREEAIGATSLGLNLFANPKDRARSVQRLKKQGNLHEMELKGRRKSGELCDIILSSEPIEIAGEACILSILSDVTERKRIEEVMRDSEERYRTIYENSTIGLYRTTPDGQILLANPALLSMLGYASLDELKERNLEKEGFAPGYERRTFLKTIRQKKSVTGIESAWTRKDGTTIFVRESAKTITDEKGKVVYYEGAVEDITTRVEAEKKLRENESRFRALIENAAEMIVVIDEAGVIQFASPSTETIMGHTPESALGKSFMNWIHPDDLALARESVESRSNLLGTAPESIIVRARHKNGDWRWMETLGTNLLDDPVIHGIVLNARDVTRRRQEETIREVRLRLLQIADGHSMVEFLQATLNELEILTESKIGFYHFMEPDQETISLQTWSTRTLNEFCTAEGEGRRYNLANAIIWVDCVRQRRAVIHNDYAHLEERKGLPEGHAVILRELVTPVFRGGQIVAILGVGNKPEDYTERDVEIVSNLADLAWDIAERKQAEEALRASEERYQTVADFTHDWEFWSAPDGQIKYVSPSCERVTGYRAEEFIGNPNLMHDIVHSDDRAAYERHLALVNNNLPDSHNSTYEAEFRILHRDGGARWMGHVCQNIHRPDGTYLGQRGSNRDITARKQAEARYQSLYDQSHDAIFILDLKGNHIQTNQRAADMLGYALEEIQGLSFNETSAQVEESRDVLERVVRGEQIPLYERVFRKKDGTPLTVEINVELARDADGNPMHIQSVVRDITERVRAQSILRESEAKYRSLIEQLPAIVYLDLMDGKGTTLFISPQVQTILGISAEEWLPNLSVWLNSIHPDDRLQAMKAYNDIAETGTTLEMEYRMIRQDGRQVWIHDRGTILVGSDGQRLLQGVMFDVTELKQAEEKLQLQGAALEAVANTVVITDRNGLIEWANPSFNAVTGFASQDVIGRRSGDLIKSGRQDEAFYKTMWDTILSGQVWNGELINRRKDGSLYKEEMTITPLRDQQGEIRHFIAVKQDITERKRAEDALRESEASLNRAQTIAHIGSWNLDVRQNRLIWSAETYRIFGVAPGLPLDYEAFLAYVHPDDRDMVDAAWQAALRGATYDIEHRIVVGEQVKWVRERAELEADAEGGTVRGVGTVQDITERKLAEEARKLAEALYRSIFEGAIEGIYQSTPEGRFITVNPALARMWGYDSPEDLLTSIRDISRQVYARPQRREEFMRLMNEQGEARGFEFEALRKDGEIIWVSENARAVRDENGTLLYYEGNIIDITEQIWADLQLKRMLGIVNASLNEIYVFNAHTLIFEYVNLGAQNNLGYSLNQLRLMTPLDLKPEFTEETFRELLQPLMGGQGSALVFETIHRRADGSLYPVEVHLQLVGQEDDKVFLSVIFDITERRQSQQALHESEERIQNIIRHSSSMFYAHTPEHVLTYVSPQSREILGCDPEEAMVRWQEFLSDHPVNALGIASTERAIQTGQRQQPYELELITHDRRKIWVRVDESPVLRDGKTAAIVGSITDITERKKTEETLRESEKLLREAQAVAGLGSYMLDMSAGAWKSSELLDGIFGIDEAYARDVAGWVALIHPEDRDMMTNYFAGEVIGQRKNFDKEYRIVRVADQSSRWVHGLGKLEFNADGQPVMMHGTIQDITSRKLHERELEAEAMLAQALSETLELQPLLDQLLKAACHAIPAGEKGSLALMTDNERLQVMATRGYQPTVAGFAYASTWGYGGRAIRQRRPILIEDIASDSALHNDASSVMVDEIREIRSAIAVPLLIHETAIGVLSIESSKPGAFTESDLRLLVNFASSAALIIERARLFDETRRHATETATLLQTSLALTDLDLKSTLQTIGSHASALFETDACRIFLTDEAEEDTLRCVLALGENQSVMLGLKIRLGEGVTGDVAAKGHAEIVNNMDGDARSVQVPGTPEEQEAIMFAPLKSGDRVIGVMSVKRLGQSHPFVLSDLELLKAFASMSASAVSNARLFEETHQRVIEQTTIHQIAQRLTQLHTPDLLAQEIIKILEETLHYEYGAVLLTSKDGTYLEPFALSDQAQDLSFQEQDKAYVKDLSIQSGRGITGWVAEHGQSIRLGDAPQDPRYLAVREGIHSELCVPLRIGERVIGVVNVESRRSNAFSESDQRVLETVAAQIAISVNNADLFEGTRQQVTELEMLYESGMDLSQTLSPKEIAERVIHLLEQKMGWHHATVRLYHPQDDTFELLAFNQPGLVSDAERREVGRNFNALIPGPGKGLSGWAFQNSQIVRSGDVRSDPRYIETHPNLKSGLYVPIRSGQKTIGVISIESEQSNAFSEADERLTATLANQAASALENARLFDEVRQRVVKLETINRVSIALRAITNQKAILAIVLEEILKALNITVGSIRIWNHETQDLRQEAARGWTAELGQEALKPGEGIIGKVFESGEMYITQDLSKDPLTLPRSRHKMPQNWGGVCALIRSSDEPLGVLLVAAPSSREFGKEETRLINTLAEMTGSALHRMNLYNETLHRAREFESLYETSRAISAEGNLNALLETIVKSAIDMLGATGGGMYLYDAVTQEVETVVATQISVPHGARLKLGEGLAGRVAEAREPIRIEDYSLWEGRSPQFEGLPIRAVLEVPILYGGELIGVLVAEETGESTRKFSDADERLLTLFASQAAGAIKSARLHEETLHRLKQLQALRVIDRAIAGSLDKRVTLNILVDQVISQLDADAADVLLLNPYLQTLQFAAGHGFRTHLSETTELHMSASFAGRAVLERRIQRLYNNEAASRNPEFYRFWTHEGFNSYHAVPLIAKGEVIGVIEVFHRTAFQPDLEWINFLETLADQTAIALDSAQMFENVQNMNMELSLAYEATIEGWSRAMDLRDEETEGHTQRVAEMAVTLARGMGFDGEELLHVRRGALLHDIGKIGVPDDILHKRGPLTDGEWQIMRQHPKFAYNMLTPIAYLRQSLDIPYKHHEKWDGTGYPQGLAGNQIPLSARIFAVVDVYDALTSDRPYRKAWTHEETIKYIREQSGKQFDPLVVEKFIEEFGEKTT